MVRSQSQDRAVSAKRFKGWQAALAAAVMMLASVASVAWIESRPRDASEVAVIFAPWTTRDDAFARVLAADGLVMREGIIESILVVHGANSGLINRLYAVGAWAVIDPVAFGGCLVKSRSRTVRTHVRRRRCRSQAWFSSAPAPDGSLSLRYGCIFRCSRPSASSTAPNGRRRCSWAGSPSAWRQRLGSMTSRVRWRAM